MIIINSENLTNKQELNNTIKNEPEEIIVEDAWDSYNLAEYVEVLPEMARPFAVNAQNALEQIQNALYQMPSFINLIKSMIPKSSYQAVLTDEQKQKIASGALKIMAKKDGSLLATLVDPETGKIVAKVPLKEIKTTPDLTQAMSNYATQMQLANIAKGIEELQIAVEEVHQGQEYDRLATAHSTKQKLFQAMAMKKPELKRAALLRIACDAEDCRNLLMLSQKANVEFIKSQPESNIMKFITGGNPKKIDSRMNEIREGLCAINMVSLVQFVAYREIGEETSAKISLKYYSDYIEGTFFKTEGLIDRLNSIDPSPKQYWSEILPEIQQGLKSLPNYSVPLLKE